MAIPLGSLKPPPVNPPDPESTKPVGDSLATLLPTIEFGNPRVARTIDGDAIVIIQSAFSHRNRHRKVIRLRAERGRKHSRNTPVT